MRNHFIFLTLLVLLPLLAGLAQSKDSIATPYSDPERMQSGVVKIRAGIDEGETEKTWQTGTGFVVRKHKDRHYILTVTHVVKGADEILVEYRHRRHRALRAKVLNMQGGDRNGLALLIVDAPAPPGTTTLYFHTTPPGKLPVLAIGFPRRGDPWQITKGMVTEIQKTRLSFSGGVDSGNSGGPLLGRFGHVVGIVTSTSGATGYATPTSRITAALAAWEFRVPNHPPLSGKGTNFPDEWAVALGSFSHRAFQNGKELLAVNHFIKKMYRYDSNFKLLGKEAFHLPIGVPLQRSDGSLLWHTAQADGAPGQRNFFIIRGISGKVQRIKLQTRDRFDQFLELPEGQILAVISRGPRRMLARINATTGQTLAAPEELCAAGQIQHMAADQKGNVFLLGKCGAGEPHTLLRRAPSGTLQRYTFETSKYSKFAGLVVTRSGAALVLLQDNNLQVPVYKTILMKFSADLKLLSERNFALAETHRTIPGTLWELKNNHLVLVNIDTLQERKPPYKTTYSTSVNYISPAGVPLWRRQFLVRGGFAGDSLSFYSLIEGKNNTFILGGLDNRNKGIGGFLYALNYKGESVPPRLK